MARVAGNAAALKLQHAGGIRHRRGHIVLLDRERPQKCACEQTAHGATAKMRLLLPFND